MNRAESLPHYLGALAEFKNKFGHTNVPRTYEENPSLAAWVRSVRSAWREGRLHPINIEQLTAAEFCFEPLAESWQTQYLKLSEYVREHGHAKVPRDYEDRPLAIWVMHQRDHWKAGTLTKEQLHLLTKLKFVFEPQDAQWADNLTRLSQFKALHGHALVPRRYADDPKLENFAAEMRKRFKSSDLTEKQVSDLIAMDFIFDPIEAVWSQNLSDYAQWRAANPDVETPPRRIAGVPFPLYEWCRVQAKNLNEGKMPADRRARLAKAGFDIAC
jgi:hypothetical protein